MTNFDIYRLKKAGMSNLLIYQFLTLTADCQEKTLWSAYLPLFANQI